MNSVKAIAIECLLLAACAPATGALGGLPTVPPYWSVHEAAGLRIAAPTAWIGPEVLAARDAAGPRAWIVFRDRSGAEVVQILTWRDTTADAVAKAQFQSEIPRGELKELTLSEGGRARPTVSVTAFAQWSDATHSGTYECRHLYVQIDAKLVADVGVCGAHVRGSSTPAPDLLRTQERVALLLGPAGGQP